MSIKRNTIASRYLYPRITEREKGKSPKDIFNHLLEVFNGYIVEKDLKICYEHADQISSGKFYYLRIKVENTHTNNDIILRRFKADKYFVMNTINRPNHNNKCE